MNLLIKSPQNGRITHPGVSVASVALARGLNANLLRRWVIEAEGRTRPAAQLPVMPSFVPVRIAKPKPAVSAEPPIRIQLRQGATEVTIEWPTTHPAACVVWLRELLR
jgi:transposase